MLHVLDAVKLFSEILFDASINYAGFDSKNQ